MIRSGIARELLAITGSPALYVADLDAILGTGNHFDMCRELADALPGTDLWIDGGFGDVTDCAFWLPLGANLVVGSESLLAIENWHDLHAVFGQSLVLSLDFTSDGLRGPQALLSEPGLWPDQLVVMSLGRVGTERGPDLEHLRAVVGSGRGRAVHAAGGVRNVGDLEAVAAAGAVERWLRPHCILAPSPKTKSPPSCEGGDPKRRGKAPVAQKPSFWSHRRIGPGGLPALSRPGGSPFQPAANGWWALSFFAVTSEAFGSPLTARAMDSLTAR